MKEHELIRAAAAGSPRPSTDRRSFQLGSLTFRPCACGAWLGADERDQDGVMSIMRAHIGTLRHVAWRTRAGVA